MLRFPVQSDGLTSRSTLDGGIQFVDATGVVAFVIPPAFAFDARAGVHTPGNAYTAVPQELSSGPDGTRLVLTPPLKWLQDPARVYPVVIDPTVLTAPWNAMNLGVMPWGNNSAGAQFSYSTDEMQFGNWFGSSWRSFTQFDPSLFADKTILRATLNLYVSACGSSPAGSEYSYPIHVRRLMSPYWFGQNWPGPQATEDVTIVANGPGRFAIGDVTSLVKSWANRASNYGLSLDMDAVSNHYCKVIRTGSSSTTSSMDITYEDTANFVDNGSFESGLDRWEVCANPSNVDWTAWGLSNPFDGLLMLRFRSRTGYGMICQLKPYSPKAGDLYHLSLRVRSASGSPVDGSADLFELLPGGNGFAGFRAKFVADASWQYVELWACAHNADATTLQIALITNTAYQDLDIDAVRLTISNPSTCSPDPSTHSPTTTTVVPSLSTSTTTGSTTSTTSPASTSTSSTSTSPTSSTTSSPTSSTSSSATTSSVAKIAAGARRFPSRFGH